MASHKQWIESRLNKGISLTELKTSAQNLLKSASYSTKNDINQKIKAIELYEKELELKNNEERTKNNTSIYILKLQNGKYYVGKSDNPMIRYQEHLNGNGSAWTNKYKPITVEKIIENASNFDEDKYTKEYMANFGIDNVRGGTYVSINLSTTQKETLQTEIWAAQNKCINCGKTGHFVSECYVKSNANSNNSSTKMPNQKVYKESNTCYRCGREGHYANECYAKTSVKPSYNYMPKRHYYNSYHTDSDSDSYDSDSDSYDSDSDSYDDDYCSD